MVLLSSLEAHILITIVVQERVVAVLSPFVIEASFCYYKQKICQGVDVWGCPELLLEIGEERPNEVGVEIYTFRDGRPNSGLWREVENFPSMRMLWVESSSVVANGAMH